MRYLDLYQDWFSVRLFRTSKQQVGNIAIYRLLFKAGVVELLQVKGFQLTGMAFFWLGKRTITLIGAIDISVVTDLKRAFSVILLFNQTFRQLVEVCLCSTMVVIATMRKMPGANLAHSRNHPSTATHAVIGMRLLVFFRYLVNAYEPILLIKSIVILYSRHDKSISRCWESDPDARPR